MMEEMSTNVSATSSNEATLITLVETLREEMRLERQQVAQEMRK